MCDTVYVSPGASASGFGLFGKNSDRNPAEPQHFIIVGGREPSAESRITGDRALPVPDAGYPYAVSKPSWMWGGEMGINGRGVSIGNEAVFGKERVDRSGILGMDILRLALQSSKSAEEAAEFIIGFIETYGQGGNGAYRGTLYYHNSFLICDPERGYILETMGKRWVLKRCGSVASISNSYSIGSDFDRADARTGSSGRPEASGGPDWKRTVESRFYSFFSRGDIRRDFSFSWLDSRKGSLNANDLFTLLREHNTFSPDRPNRRNMESLCVHGGGLLNNATTASMVVEYRGAEAGRDGEGPSAVIWYTGTSCPCISLYKPVVLRNGDFYPLCLSCVVETDGAVPPVPEAAVPSVPDIAQSMWEAQYRRIREGAGGLSLSEEFTAERDRIQKEMEAAVGTWLSGREEEGVRMATREAERFEQLIDGMIGGR